MCNLKCVYGYSEAFLKDIYVIRDRYLCLYVIDLIVYPKIQFVLNHNSKMKNQSFFLLAQAITYRVCQEKYHDLYAKALEFLLVSRS